MVNIDYWLFDGTIVDDVISETFDRQLGKRQTVRLKFTNNNRSTGHKDRYFTVLDYALYAGETSYGRQLQGGFWYQENISTNAPVSSLVVPIEPSPSQTGNPYEGIWCIVTDHSNPNRLSNRLIVDMEIVYIADRSDYTDRTAVENEFGTSPV